ncbi:MAG: transposase [Methanoregula sp.]|nr:transposase [Methanoregula sp.]
MRVFLKRVPGEDPARTHNLFTGEPEADERYFRGQQKGKRGRGAGNKTIVFFLILERGGKVSVSIVTHLNAESLMNKTVRKVQRGSMVYPDEWRDSDSVIFSEYCHFSIDHRYKSKQGKVCINGICGSCSFAHERLVVHQIVLVVDVAESKKKFCGMGLDCTKNRAPVISLNIGE